MCDRIFRYFSIFLYIIVLDGIEICIYFFFTITKKSEIKNWKEKYKIISIFDILIQTKHIKYLFKKHFLRNSIYI